MSINHKTAKGEARSNKPYSTPTNLEDCKPWATRDEVFSALKKVAKSPKPSLKHGEQPAPTSSKT